MARTMAFLAVTALGASGCLPLVVGPNNFRPAGEVGVRPYAVTGSIEASRLLTLGFSTDPTSEKAVWFSQDVSAQIGLAERVALDVQMKWASTIPTLVALPIGGALGARSTVLKQEKHGISLDVAFKGVGVSATNTEPNLGGGPNRSLTATAWGGELHVPVSWRAASWFALTMSPFARGYALTVTPEGGGRQRAFIAGGGASLSAEFKAGGFVVAPAVAVETLTGTDQLQGLSVAPGLAIGARW